MSDSVYQAAIMALAKSANNNGDITDATARCQRSNPLCGDEIILAAVTDTMSLHRLAHRTRGCVLCKAATTKMLQLAAQYPQQSTLHKMCRDVIHMFGEKKIIASMDVFTPVIEHPARYGCVQLPFEALIDILQCGKHKEDNY
ncbi:iron-sulfur cluster assembly scaffold protein [Candidatus Persebacteraceae bacterium Df01]|jgi:nitrogen fixation NifU-like protein|uniref:Iron-sulfur cluster assembly scaffold protein n=1 Tax=Candidatus Doriopsillibacter californiensis TaxID=2970740 RepID=A0ABT7QM44_9GAMM|nr:iron-sulfur cluster assembly scaffold protein [Candidatus Persebacteraceae bacterium Df01]